MRVAECVKFWARGEKAMQDMKVYLEKLRADPEECARIGRQTIEQMKQKLFVRLSECLKALASEVERASKDGRAGGEG
jgi:hypothetical protein